MYDKQSYLWSSCGDSEVPMQPVQSQVSLAVFVQLESPMLRLPLRPRRRVCSGLSDSGLRSSLGRCRSVSAEAGLGVVVPRKQAVLAPKMDFTASSRAEAGIVWHEGSGSSVRLRGVLSPVCGLGALFSPRSSNPAGLVIILCQSTDPECLMVAQRGTVSTEGVGQPSVMGS